jgi:hypothetical protein
VHARRPADALSATAGAGRGPRRPPPPLCPRRTLLELVGGHEGDGPLGEADERGAAHRLPQQLVAAQQVEVAAARDLAGAAGRGGGAARERARVGGRPGQSRRLGKRSPGLDRASLAPPRIAPPQPPPTAQGAPRPLPRRACPPPPPHLGVHKAVQLLVAARPLGRLGLGLEAGRRVDAVVEVTHLGGGVGRGYGGMGMGRATRACSALREAGVWRSRSCGLCPSLPLVSPISAGRRRPCRSPTPRPPPQTRRLEGEEGKRERVAGDDAAAPARCSGGPSAGSPPRAPRPRVPVASVLSAPLAPSLPLPPPAAAAAPEELWKRRERTILA